MKNPVMMRRKKTEKKKPVEVQLWEKELLKGLEEEVQNLVLAGGAGYKQQIILSLSEVCKI